MILFMIKTSIDVLFASIISASYKLNNCDIDCHNTQSDRSEML